MKIISYIWINYIKSPICATLNTVLTTGLSVIQSLKPLILTSKKKLAERYAILINRWNYLINNIKTQTDRVLRKYLITVTAGKQQYSLTKIIMQACLIRLRVDLLLLVTRLYKKVPYDLRPTQLWDHYFVIIYENLTMYSQHYYVIWVKGIKNTTVLSGLLPVTVFIDIYCSFFNCSYALYSLVFWFIISLLSTLYVGVTKQSPKQIRLICLQTYFTPILWFNDIILEVVGKLNPFSILGFIVWCLDVNRVISKYPRIVFILNWCVTLPDILIRLYVFYYLVLKLNLGFILIYYLLKLARLAITGNISWIKVWAFITKGFKHTIGFFLVFIVCSLSAWLLGFKLIFLTLFRVSLCLWWSGRLIVSLHSINYSAGGTSYAVQTLNANLVAGFTGSYFGVQYFIIPYANPKTSFPSLKRVFTPIPAFKQVKIELTIQARLDWQNHVTLKSPSLGCKFTFSSWKFNHPNIEIANYRLSDELNFTGKHAEQWVNSHTVPDPEWGGQKHLPLAVEDKLLSSDLFIRFIVAKNFCSVNSLDFQSPDASVIKSYLAEEPSLFFLRDILIKNNISTFRELDNFISDNLEYKVEFYKEVCKVHNFFNEIKRINGIITVDSPPTDELIIAIKTFPPLIGP